jgi:hypothetical protein
MKRVLPILILATIAETIAWIFLGIYLFKNRGLPSGGSIGIHYIWPAVLYIILSIIGYVFHIPLKYISLDNMYYPWRDVGDRFDGSEFTPFVCTKLRAQLYNYIDAFDFSPIKKRFLSFWGY